jgi:hypothetical protein
MYSYLSITWWRHFLHDLRPMIIKPERRQCFGGRSSLMLNNCVVLSLIHSIWEQVDNIVRPPPSNRWSPPVDAISRTLLSPSRCPVGTELSVPTPLARASPSLCPVGPTRQPSCTFAHPLSLTRGSHLSEPPPSNRTCPPPWTHPQQCVFWPRPHTPEPSLEPAHTHLPSPAQLRPQPSTLAPSLDVHAPRELRHRSPSSHARSAVAVEPSPCLLPQWALPRHPWPGTPLGSPPLPLSLSTTLNSSLSAPPQLRRRWPVSSPCPGRRSRVLELPLKVTDLTLPLISPGMPLVTRDCSPEYSPVYRGLPLRRLAASAPFMQPRPHHNSYQVIPNLSSYPDQPIAP